MCFVGQNKDKTVKIKGFPVEQKLKAAKKKWSVGQNKEAVIKKNYFVSPNKKR